MSDPTDIVVSAETLDRMKKELDELVTAGREEASVRLLRAREMGDLKENAEYHSAKDAQGMMEARIRQLQATINKAVVREGPASTESVTPGLIVTVKDGDETQEYLLAHSIEEKFGTLRTITLSSPLGKGLMGKKPGEVAEIEAPGGRFSVQVLSVRPV